MWIVSPAVVLVLGEVVRGKGGSVGESVMFMYASLILIVALFVKVLCLLENAYRTRRAGPGREARAAVRSPAEPVIVACTLISLIACIVWFLSSNACAGGLYVCG